MSERVTEGARLRGSWQRSPVLLAVVVLAAYALVGLGAGWAWHELWQTSDGVVFQKQWYADGEALRQDFSGTGLYVLIAAGCGLVLGGVFALVGSSRPVLTLVLCVAGSLLAAWLMLTLGERLGPADPHELAKTAEDGTHLLERAAGLRPPAVARVLAGLPRGARPGLHPLPGQESRSRVEPGTSRVGCSSESTTAAPPHHSPGAPPDPTGDDPCPTPILARPSSHPSSLATRSTSRPAAARRCRPRRRRHPPAAEAASAACSSAAGIAALAVVGVGAWAAAQFFATGAQPSEALPAGTIGYASIDLDPSGAQKIEALRTLNKFPAFKDELDLEHRRRRPPDDLRGDRPARGLPAVLRRGHRAVAG